MSPALAELVRDLSRPAAYRRPVERVERLETHVSLLFFAGDRVYKVKKPVDLGFLDFTTLARRRHFCEEEVRLNARLAPGVHLGVVPITGTPGELRIGGAAEPVEWAVEMVRLPAERMLDRLLAEDAVTTAELDAVVDLLVDFHREAATGEGVDRHGSPAATEKRVLDNFEQIRRFVERHAFPGRASALARRDAERFLAERRELLLRRVAQGRIRDGHGDLHAGNLCLLGDRIIAYDRIEFSTALRCGDVAADLGFLLMDLDFRGHAGESRHLVRRYAAEAGDGELGELIDFYRSYRAMVRAKVELLTWEGESGSSRGGSDEHDAHWRRAAGYAQLAAAYGMPPLLVITCGRPGTGKSWAAERLARPLGAAVLRSDVVRKELPRGESELYSTEMTERTYEELLRRALAELAASRSIVVDATFARREHRARFIDAAARAGRRTLVLHVTAPPALVRERMARRASDPAEVSDADWQVYLDLPFDPPEPGEAPLVEHVADGRAFEPVIDALIERGHAD